MDKEDIRTCVTPDGFSFLVHRPDYTVINRRQHTKKYHLGNDQSGNEVVSHANFPQGHLEIQEATTVYEVPNPFPFWGTTYILGERAISFASAPQFKFTKGDRFQGDHKFAPFLISAIEKGEITWNDIPRHIKLSLAQNSSDPRILTGLALWCTEFELDAHGIPTGLRYSKGRGGRLTPVIRDKDLFETIANNPHLPDQFKRVMVLNPGAQGTSPIVGEYSNGSTHIWEYLRVNSYVPWGHFASNMAEDAIRYSALDLTEEDMKGLRHLYYQRIYTQMATLLGIIDAQANQKLLQLSEEELEGLRLQVAEAVTERLRRGDSLPFSGTLWGWNYGYDISSSGYRLHASHQQIHNQYALIPSPDLFGPDSPTPYMVGDMIAEFCRAFSRRWGMPFFHTYLENIRNNVRMDNGEGKPKSLVIFEDENSLLLVPKAQRSQGEIQIIAKREIGNILEADTAMRRSLDRCILLAVQGLARLGAEMVTFCEASKRFGDPNPDQRLLYYMLPRHPYSPGSFSEWQQRWITGHFPEDFAEAMRRACGLG